MNIQQTNGHSVTDALPGLLVRRNRVGAESKEGRLLSTLIEQLRNYDIETDPDARANLAWGIRWSTAKLKTLQRTA